MGRRGRRPSFSSHLVTLAHRKDADRCSNCRLRWRQDRSGLCRRCARELGDQRRVMDLEAERLARQQEKDLAALRVEPALREPRPDREIVVDGMVFAVVWDGA